MRESRSGDTPEDGSPCVLLVEGASEANAAITAALQEAGYAAHGVRLDSTSAMSEVLREQSWDAVVWSFEPFGFDPLEALAVVREGGRELPFLVVSASLAAEKAVALLKAGAQDYVALESLARLGEAIERARSEVEERRLDRREALAMRIPPEGLARLIGELRQRHTLQIQPAAALTPWAALPLHFGITVALYVPLWSGDEIVGVHAAGNFGSSPLFSAAQERIAAGIGQLASSALQSVRLLAELERRRRPADGMPRP